MFQAFIDDSKTDRKLFVLAGYIAPAETWALFSDDWDTELKSEPPLEEFKMSQMLIEPARCERFYRIIEKPVTSAISVRIDLAAHARVVASLEWPPGLNNQAEVTGPYWFAYNMIIDYLYRHHSGLHLTDRVDFIFDDQSEKKHVRDTWDYFKSTGLQNCNELWAINRSSSAVTLSSPCRRQIYGHGGCAAGSSTALKTALYGWPFRGPLGVICGVLKYSRTRRDCVRAMAS
jgi:hypothetical protein